MEKQLIKKEVNKKTTIITNNDKNNIKKYKKLNSRESKGRHSHDYYDLLKQQIKYYKELNTSLKDEIDTVKKCKKIKQLEDLNEINKLASINKEKDESNNLLSSNNNIESQEKMKHELNENDLKISDLQTKNKKVEKKEFRFKNTLDRDDFLEKNGKENIKEGGADLEGDDLQISSNFGDSKNTQTKHTNQIYDNSCSEDQCVMAKKELKRLEEENNSLKKNVIQLSQTIKKMKLKNKNNKNIININNDNEYLVNDETIQNTENLVIKNINEFKDKLIIDNKRLRMYIEKIEELKKILNQYKFQITSLNQEIKQKDEKIKILIYKLNIKNGKKNSNEEYDKEDMVNIDIKNEINKSSE